jgi:hypothetical protein
MNESRYLYCPTCRDWRDTVWTDEGIGGYEYWGARGCDVQWCESCSECDCPAHEMRESELTDEQWDALTELEQEREPSQGIDYEPCERRGMVAA